MSDGNLQIHVEMKHGAIARVSPKALNDPKFVDALNKMIGLASKWARKKELRRLRREAGGGGGFESVATEQAAAGGLGNAEREARGNVRICGDGPVARPNGD